MDSKRRLDDALDLAVGHQRPGVRLDQAMLPDLARGKLDPWQGQLDRPRVTTVWGLDSVKLSGRILLHSMFSPSDARRVPGATRKRIGKPRLIAGVFTCAVPYVALAFQSCPQSYHG